MALIQPDLPSAGVPASRSAAIGETFPARLAGTYAARTVTTTPSTIPIAGVVHLTVRSSTDSSMPIADMTFIRPTAIPTPAATPATEPKIPRSTASTSTERLTWRLLEPRARIRPISRVRWATSIEKVLTIRKMPTRKAIPAKPSIAYFSTSRNEPTLARFASAASFCVWTLYEPASSAASTSFFSRVLSTPGSAVTLMWVNRPVVPSRVRCAVSLSKKRMVAPGLVTVNAAMPEIFVVMSPVAAMVRSSSPSFRPCFFAASASIITSVGPRGACPEVISIERRSLCVQLLAIVGAPLVLPTFLSSVVTTVTP